MTPFAELAVTTNFSFLRSGSHPEEMVTEAARLGLAGIAVTDRNSVAGVVRGHAMAKEAGFRYVPGARLAFRDGTPDILAWPTDRDAWGRLCRLLTLGNRRAPKGECHLDLPDLLEWGAGLMLGVMPGSTAMLNAATAESSAVSGRGKLKVIYEAPLPEAASPLRPSLKGRVEDVAVQTPLALSLATLQEAFPDSVRLMANRLYGPGDRRRLALLARLARRTGTPLLATNDVLYHAPERRALQDVVTCIREHCTIHAAGRRLEANAERHLKDAAEMARLFQDHPQAVSESAAVIERLGFSLDQLRYNYPDEPSGDAATPQEALIRLTEEGARERYPEGVPAKVRETIAHELALIEARDYAPYFLTVHDIVRFARGRGILCQGRGSAANSAVCFCLGITEVNPGTTDLLFERFISPERDEPPDIDVDFEHERREEVMQYIYGKYGRERTGIAATVISYRTRSAVREVGKVFGLSDDTIGALAGTIWGWSSAGVREADITRVGLDPNEKTMRQVAELSQALIGFPRHLSQHVGGFVITRDRLDEMVPVMNAAMEDRTNIEWDKDDLDAVGMLKVDILALGMLSCIRRAFDFMRLHYGWAPTLATIQNEDPAVYDMLCRADSLGVFQVESRAQMTMLPRLRPREFYDLVIEVAIVRPGPIQGDMVHPYLRRRQGLETVRYPSPSPEHGPADELEKVLGRTLGVPLFQEQAMKIAMVAAKFSGGEADKLRRAMATFRRTGTIHTFRDKMVEGMVARGYERAFAERCFQQIEGFGEYGFPESHAASFALLVYASSWIKCHYPDVFCAALLNAQPMGFYAPAQIVRDAERHGIAVHPVDVNASDFDATLEGEFGLASGLGRLDNPLPTSPLQGEGAQAEPDEPDRRWSGGSNRDAASPPPARGRSGGGHESLPSISSRFDHTPTKTDRARRLRKEATNPERRLWSKLRSAQMDGVSFRRQHPMGPYVLDFYCPSLGIVIELDGEPHGFDKRAAQDRRRDAWLAACGLRVLRFWNSEIRENLDGVLDSIFHAVEAARLDDPLPSSPLQGEGAQIAPASQHRHLKGVSNSPPTSPPPEKKRPGGGQDQAFPVNETSLKTTRRLHSTNAAMADDIRSTHAVRLGFRQIKGFREEDAAALVAARGKGYDSVRDLWLRSGLSRAAIERLADADAFRSLGLDRRAALWAARELGGGGVNDRLPLFDVAEHADIRREPDVALPPMPVGEHVVNDYRYLNLSLKAHPVSFIRPQLASRRIVTNEALRTTPNGRRITVSGLAIVRQRPGTASGVIFMTIEDETDIANIVVWPKMFERYRPVVLGARFVAVTGKVQSESGVIHVIADRLEDLTGMLAVLSAEPEAKPAPGEVIDPRARADEVRRPGQDHRERAERRAGIRHPRNVRFFEDGAPAQTDAARATGAVMPKGRNFH